MLGIFFTFIRPDEAGLRVDPGESLVAYREAFDLLVRTAS